VKFTRRHLLAVAAAAGCGRPGSGYRGYALVAATGSKSVAVVDLLAFSRKNSIGLPHEPTALLAHPNPAVQLAYAVMARNSVIAEVSPTAESVKRRISLPARPRAVRAAHGRLYWIAEDKNWLGAVDLKSWSNFPPIQLAGRAISLDVSHRRKLAAVTLETGAVQLLPLDGAQPAPPLEVGSGLGSLCFRSDGDCLLVAEPASSQLSVIDIKSRSLMVRLKLALHPDRLWMKGDGGQLFITGAGVDGVAIVYPYRTEVAQTFLSGLRPGEMADSTAPDYLFVSNPEAGSVTVFSIGTQKVVAVTGVGARPGPIAITPDQQYALVVNRGSGDLAVIRIAAITPGREKRAPLFTMIPVGSAPCGIVVMGA
jgi:DNA-binding beta-propeller fold protein YncE